MSASKRSTANSILQESTKAVRVRSETQSPKVSSLPEVISISSSEEIQQIPNSTKAKQDSAENHKPAGQANSSSFYCFLCGLHSELSFSRVLYSSSPGKKAPYFPFMKKHVPKNRAETLREDGTALVCTFCYHSVMVQWARYNEARSSMAMVDPNERTYNIHEYRCFVCGVMTYRKRIRALRVMVRKTLFFLVRLTFHYDLIIFWHI